MMSIVRKMQKGAMALKQRVTLIFKGGDNVVLVYIVSLDMGLITVDQIPVYRYEEVKLVAEGMGLGHFFEK